jgi:hypothetical protein
MIHYNGRNDYKSKSCFSMRYNKIMTGEQPEGPKQIKVHIPEHLRAGAYANLTNIGVTQNEVILNFIFANELDTPNGTLVSRVIVTRRHAQGLMKLINDAVSTAEEVNPSGK